MVETEEAQGWPPAGIKWYYSDDYVAIAHADCREILPQLDKVDLVLTDPPYNIHKAEWDRIPNYLAWCGDWLKPVEVCLSDNGSFYFFHNEMPSVAELMCWIKANTRFVFKQFIVWNKRFDGYHNQLNALVDSNGLRNYSKQAEYILFYTFQDETGLKTVDNNLELFKPIRDYFQKERQKTNLSYKEINENCFGTASNGGGMASNILTPNKINWVFPTKERYEALQKIGICLRDYNELRLEYENLRLEYESLRYTFNNQKTHHSVWNYEIAERNGGHITPKPLDLIENIITHSSNEGDLIVDPFLGSGTTALAAKKLNRKCIGIEIEEKYCEIAAKRCSQQVMALNV